MKVFVQHDRLKLWLGIDGENRVFITDNPVYAKRFTDASQWTYYINKLWAANLDTRDWSIKFDFTRE